MSTGTRLYDDVAKRTKGDIYIGVVGPVRTGKSTFVKRFMEKMVVPYIENVYQRERAIDELPQSGSGKTLTTSEPKFVPEEAVTITPYENMKVSVRMIDSVGYMVPGVIGADEEGKPRMVTTPWYPEEIPMTQAAEIGTKKVMNDHCTIGIVVTTDGSILDIPRSDYSEAEKRAIQDMRSTGKPFVVVINTTSPESPTAQQLKNDLEMTHGVACICADCLHMDETDFQGLMSGIVYEFPLTEIHIQVPGWIGAMDQSFSLKTEIYDIVRGKIAPIRKLSEAESVLRELSTCKIIENTSITAIEPGSGIVFCEIWIPDHLYYDSLSKYCDFDIRNEAELIHLLKQLISVKKSYEKVSEALEEVREKGYGIVMPTPDEMHLEVPEIIRKGNNYGVKLKASAPSIHMMRADIQTEICPIVGDEKQSKDLLQYLLEEYDGDTEKIWDSNIFGKSVYELINEGLSSKLKKMPEHARTKLQTTLTRIINEGSRGLLCIILA